MKKIEIEKIVDDVFKEQFSKTISVICNPLYYKNIFLKYAMIHHNSVQCIIRTYLEMLKSSLRFTNRRFDVWEINQLLIFINTFQNRKMLKYVDQIMSERIASFSNPDYIIRNTEDRFKSARSTISKLRTCEATEETLLYIEKHFNSISSFKEFTTAEKCIAKKILKAMWDANYKKSPIKDLIGYRDIVYAYNNSTDDSITIPFVYQLMKESKIFFQEKGFDIIVFKDYIKNPKKDHGYQSLHMTVDIVGTKLELQGRTGLMHEEAQYGNYSHDKIYKDKPIQNFLSEFMYTTAKDLGRITMYEGIGILKEVSLSNMPVCKTPHSEVPRFPDELQMFTDLLSIQNVIKHSPKFNNLS